MGDIGTRALFICHIFGTIILKTWGASRRVDSAGLDCCLCDRVLLSIFHVNIIIERTISISRINDNSSYCVLDSISSLLPSIVSSKDIGFE